MSYIDILIRMIWDYQIISLDMFIHILTLRSYTGQFPLIKRQS